MSEMVERVAEALWDLHQAKDYTIWSHNEMMYGRKWAGRRVPWSYVTSPSVISSVAEEYRVQARAAIAAMREPAEAMAKEGHWSAGSQDADETWRDMIDAALDENPD